MSENIVKAFQLMGFGLGGVFITLAAFIVLISLLVRVFPGNSEENGSDSNS